MAKLAKVGKSYQKHFNNEWMGEGAFKSWLTRNTEVNILKGKGEAWCKLCLCSLRAQRNDLMDHKKTKKHQKKEEALKIDNEGRSQSTLPHLLAKSDAEKNKLKRNDLKLATHIACHSSLKSIDHLGELIKSLGEGSKLESLKLHRTKCSKIIVNVLAPEMLKEIVKDLGVNQYSLIVDESTDVSSKKYMAVLIKYYSFKKAEMMIDFLGLIQVTRTTAEVLYDSLKAFMAEVGIPLNRMIGLGTDGAANMCGLNQSLYALLKRRDCPKLELIRCLCHSLDKCCSYASSELPSTLEFMIKETTNFFAHSAIRKQTYAEVYKAFNHGKEPPMLVKLSATRWLSWGEAVSRVYDQYEPLKQMFTTEALRPAGGDQNKCYSVKILSQMFNDNTNLLYFSFLRPVLQEVNRVNKLFQSSNADVTKIYQDLRIFIFSLARRILRAESVPSANATDGIIRSVELSALKSALKEARSFRHLDQMDFGESFKTLIATLALPSQALHTVRERCANFLTRLMREMTERLPTSVEVIERLRFLTPKRVLDRRGRPTFSQLPLDLAPDNVDKSLLESQWARLGELSLADICSGFEEDIDVVKFWGAIWQMKDSVGEQPFQELALYVLSLLSLPLSNAAVERLFSLLALVKSKIRNKLSLRMLEAILRVKFHLQALRICCTKFEPSAEMLNAVKSTVLYGTREERESSTADPDCPECVDAHECEKDDEDDVLTFEFLCDLDVAAYVEI